MHIEISGRLASGTCSLTGKEGVEVFQVRANQGDMMNVSTNRLVEVLRMLCGVGGEQQDGDRPDNSSQKTKPLT